MTRDWDEVGVLDWWLVGFVVHFEDQKPDYDYITELSRRRDIQTKIDLLKTRVQLTNATTNVIYLEKEIRVLTVIEESVKIAKDR